jgi:hypothetical protein
VGSAASLSLYRPEHLSEVTPRMWKLYADTAAEEGYQGDPRELRLCAHICVADSDAEAYELGRNFLLAARADV